MIRRIRAERDASIKLIPESRAGDIPIAGEAARVHARNARRGATRFDSPRTAYGAPQFIILSLSRQSGAQAPRHFPAGSKMYRKSYVHCAVYVPVFQITALAFRVRSERNKASGRARRNCSVLDREMIDPWRKGSRHELSVNFAKYITSRACSRKRRNVCWIALSCRVIRRMQRTKRRTKHHAIALYLAFIS